MAKKWIMALAIGFLMCSGARALDPGKAVTQYTIDSWNENSGLPQSSVLTLLQTGDGYLWVGTEEGLARFDGVSFTVFNGDNTPALSSNYIGRLFEDSKKNLWIGTLGGGLAIYRGGKFQRFREKEGFAAHTIYSLREDSFNHIWIGTDDGGLIQWNELTQTFTRYTTKEGLPDNVIHAICPDHQGHLWIATPKGLCRFDRHRFIPCPRENNPGKESFNAVFEDSDYNLWVGSDKGLFQVKGGKFLPIPLAGNSTTIIRAICEDKDKNIWIATKDSGLFRYHKGKCSVLTKKDGLLADEVLAVSQDREGNLWIGTAYGGLNRLKDEKFTTITTREGLSDDIVFSICEDQKGRLWFGTNNGLNRYQKGAFMRVTTKEGLTHNAVDTLFEDRQGFIWAGTDAGLNRLVDSPSKIVKTHDFLKDHYIPAIHEDQSGYLWAGTLYGASKIKGNRVIQTLTQKDGLGTNAVTFIFEDSRGNLWFCTLRGGMTRCKNGQFTVFTTKDGLAANTVQCMYEDAEAVLWLGTPNGLSRFKDGKFTTFTKKDGLFHNNIYQVLEDKDQCLWMSSNKGISRVSKKDLKDFADGKLRHFESVAYGKENGMRSNECNGGYQSAGCKTRDGRLWFPTVKGVVSIDPANIRTNHIPPPVAIEQVRLDGATAHLGQEVVIPPGIKRLEIHYTALSYVNPARVKFKYKLEGYDDEWVNAGSLRAAFYTNLDADSYTFRVIACNDDGVWNRTGAAIGIRVIPPYWETWWFRVLAFIGFSVFSYSIIHFSGKYLAMTAFWKKQKFVGNFKLLDMIGSGGMGAIYKAINLSDKSETVAIKVLKDEMFADEKIRKRFKQEAAIIDQLDHPNIVKVIERGQSRQSLFIAMEYLQGITLNKKIQAEKKLVLTEALHIMIQVADAMTKIHAKNIIHRDLKPDNIMLIQKDQDPNFVKLLDFGLAKMQYQTSLTQTGIVIGTINYLSPEQISGKGSSPASDIYALGIIFYEMLTGEKPFIGETTIDIMKQIMDKTPIEPQRFRDDISPRLNHLIIRMLDKDIKLRPVIYDVLAYLKDIEMGNPGLV